MLGINVDAGETGRIVGQASYGVILHMVKRWIKDEPREHLLRGVLHLGAALNPSTSVDGLSIIEHQSEIECVYTLKIADDPIM